MGFTLSVICCGRPIELDKPHILALVVETGFLLFKEQVPLKFKKERTAVQCERKTFRLISPSTPGSFRWTVPLRGPGVYGLGRGGDVIYVYISFVLLRYC